MSAPTCRRDAVRLATSLLIGALALGLALTACAPFEPSPTLKVRPTPGPSTPLPVAVLATLTPPPPPATATPTPAPTPTPIPNFRVDQPIDLGQLTVTVTRVQRYDGAARCPGSAHGLEIDFRILNRGQETIGVELIDSVVLDAQGRTLRPSNIYLREVRDVLPLFTERLGYTICILPDSSNLRLVVAPASYRGFDRVATARAIVELEPDGVPLPVAPRPTVPPTATAGR